MIRTNTPIITYIIELLAVFIFSSSQCENMIWDHIYITISITAIHTKPFIQLIILKIILVPSLKFFLLQLKPFKNDLSQ